MVKVALQAYDGAIEQISITGDFFSHPEGAIDSVEERLRGAMGGQVASRVREVLGEGTITIGFNPEELILMIEECLR